jgi:CBS domain-containing protein
MVRTAREVMHAHTFVAADMSVRDVARLMTDKRIGSVLVKSEGGLGILTERDIVAKTIVAGADPSRVSAKDIMTCPVATVGPDVDVYQISAIFNENGFRRLPVVENGRVLGILTTRDIAKEFIPQFFKETYHFKDFRF